MPQKNRNYSDPLDELLDKLTSGYYVDQSVNEFSSTVNDTVKNYQRRSFLPLIPPPMRAAMLR